MIRVRYRFSLLPGAAAQFAALWREASLHIQARCPGARGSILLQDTQGEYRAIARWESAEHWSAARDPAEQAVPPAVAERMRACLAAPSSCELAEERDEVPALTRPAGTPAAEALAMPAGAWGAVFVGVSVDGFPARADGALDFLSAGGGEPHGYEEFMAGVDALVIGRKTFETVLAFPEWPYGAKRVIVLSTRKRRLPSLSEGSVETMDAAPAVVLERLGAQGVRQVYVDGGLTIQGFLRAGLIRRLVVTRVPILIGQGIPLFGALARDQPLRHLATRHYPSGLVQSEYWIDPST